MSEKIKYLQKYSIPSIVPVKDADLAKYIHLAKSAIRYAKQHLKLKLEPEDYKLFLKDAIYAASCLLRAELTLAYKLKNIKTNQGRRTDLLKKAIDTKNRTKKEILVNDFNLTPNQAKQISRLNEYGVEEAIKYGEQNNEIPTRKLALSFIQQKQKQENNNPVKLHPSYVRKNISVFALEELKPIRSTTLFANVGICEWFLPFARIHNVNGNELLPERIRWHEEVYKDCEMIKKLDENGKFTGDIWDKDIQDEIVRKHIEKGCSLIIATPPCQTFTVAGKRDFNDPRTQLFVPMLEIIKRVNDVNQYVLIENVPEYLTAKPKNIQNIIGNKTIAQYIKKELQKLGYKVNMDILNAANYGTPQHRERLIILASKCGVWKFPKPFPKQLTLMNAIGDLPSIEAGQKPHYRDKYSRFINSAPALEKCEVEFLKHTPTGKSAWDNPKKYQPVNSDGTPSHAKHRASFSREDWAKPASTITSDSDYIGGHNTIHPGHLLADGTYSDARVYTIQEKLILTGFERISGAGLPIYKIPNFAIGNRKLITEVLGESFLPRLAYYLALEIPNRTQCSQENIDNFPSLYCVDGPDEDGLIFTYPKMLLTEVL